MESSESEGEGVGEGGEMEESEEEEEEGDDEGEEEEEETDSEEVIATHSLRSRRSNTRKRRSNRLHQKQQQKKKKTQSKPVGRGGKPGRKPKAKKPGPKPAMKSKKKLNMTSLHQPAPSSRAESVVSAIIELRCSRGGRGESGAMRREQRGLEMQLCEALWEEISGHDCSWPFADPVKKREVSEWSN